MKILVACEFSGTVRDSFIRGGHDAISCDLLPTDKPGPHYQGNVFDIVDKGFDMIIAHPPCTYLTLAGNKWFLPQYKDRFPTRVQDRKDAIEFFVRLWNVPIKKKCFENPIGVLSTHFRKPDQIIQPYHFGHTDRKPTCLWLEGLPKLVHTNVVEPNIKKNKNGNTASVHHDYALRLPALERMKFRAKTYQGIADAMANQWGKSEPLTIESLGYRLAVEPSKPTLTKEQIDELFKENDSNEAI